MGGIRDQARGLTPVGLALAASVGLWACYHSALSPVRFPSGAVHRVPLLDPDDARALYVPARINGHGPYLFHVDTGAWQSTLSKDLAAELGVVAEPATPRRRRLIIVDASGVERSYEGARLERLDLGPALSLRDVGVGLFPDRPSSRAGLRVAGLLGMNVLRNLRLVIDLDAGELVLTRRGGGQGRGEASQGLSLPLALTDEGRKIWVQVGIGGRSLPFVVDTGASRSGIDEAVGRALRLPFDRRQAGQAEALSSTLRFRGMFRPPLVMLGALQLPGLELRPLPRERDSGARAGLLGLDVLGRFRSELDLRGRRLHLLPRRSAISGEALAGRVGRWPELPRCPPPGRNRPRGPGEPDDGRSASFAGCVSLGPLQATPGHPGRTEAQLTLSRRPAGAVRLLLAVASEAGTPLPAPYRLGIIVSPASGATGLSRRVLLPRLPDDLEPRLSAGARLTLIDAAPHAEPCPVPVCTFWQRR